MRQFVIFATVLLVSSLLHGCVTTAVAIISELDKGSYLNKIGYFSASEDVQLENGTLLRAKSLNDERQRGWSEYLICVEPRIASPIPQYGNYSIELDLRQITLRFDSGKNVHPDKFAIRDFHCPVLDASAAHDYEALLRAPFRANPNEYIKLNSRPGGQWLQTLVLHFNQAPPLPSERFSLDFGRYVTDGKELAVPFLRFAKCHAATDCSN